MAAAATADPETSGLLVISRGSAVANPLLAVVQRLSNDLRKLSVEFGLTPASRTRLHAGPAQQERKFSGLAL